jgi:adenosylhomocysteine nucleosidase
LTVEAERPLGADLRVAVLYALADEVRYCRQILQPIEEAPAGVNISGRQVGSSKSANGALAGSLCIGVGAECAAQNTERLLIQNPSTRAIVVVGYAGGLSRSVEPGSLIIAESVSNAGSEHLYTPDPALLAAASEVWPPGFRAKIGALVTADRVLVRASEKELIARSTNALAVDMESAGAAAVATEYGVPWLAVRVITDGVNDDLPLDFNALANPDGSVNRGRIVAETLLHPWKIPALVRLGSRSSLASRRLAEFLILLLPRIALG